MSDEPTSQASVCEIMGCSSGATTTRWIITEDSGKRVLRVCWEHNEGEIDPEQIQAGV